METEEKILREQLASYSSNLLSLFCKFIKVSSIDIDTFKNILGALTLYIKSGGNDYLSYAIELEKCNVILKTDTEKQELGVIKEELKKIIKEEQEKNNLFEEKKGTYTK